MTTTERLPARHCIARAIELNGWSPDTIEDVLENPFSFHATIAHARTLEEYGYREPVDPIRKRAREICAEVLRREGYPVMAGRCLSGDHDDWPMMQATEKALRESRL